MADSNVRIDSGIARLVLPLCKMPSKISTSCTNNGRGKEVSKSFSSLIPRTTSSIERSAISRGERLVGFSVVHIRDASTGCWNSITSLHIAPDRFCFRSFAMALTNFDHSRVSFSKGAEECMTASKTCCSILSDGLHELRRMDSAQLVSIELRTSVSLEARLARR